MDPDALYLNVFISFKPAPLLHPVQDSAVNKRDSNCRASFLLSSLKQTQAEMKNLLDKFLSRFLY